MNTHYYESRISFIVIVACLVFETLVVLLGLLQVYQPGVTILMTICMCLIFLSFFSVQVLLTDDELKVVYGIGLYRKIIPLPLVAECEIVPNNFVTWIFNPGLSHVLAISLRNGGRCIIGIGDAKRLRDLLATNMRG